MTYFPVKLPSGTATATTLADANTIQVTQGGIVKLATLGVLRTYVQGSTAATGPTGGATGASGSTGTTSSTGSTGSTSATAARVESAEGTSITTVGPVITDAAGNTYGISANGYVLTNGAEETTISANVVRLYYHAPTTGGTRQLYQENSAGNWYTRTSITATYTGPVTDPTVAASTGATSSTGVAYALPAPTGSASNTVPAAAGSDVQVYLNARQGWNVPATLYGISCGHMSLDNVQKYSALATTNLQNAIGQLRFGLIRLNWDRTTTMSYAFDSGTFDSSSVDNFINNAGVFNFPSTQLIITIGWSTAVENAMAAGNPDSVTSLHQSQCNQMATYFKSKGLTGIYWEMVNEPDPYQTSDMLALAKVFNAMRAGIMAADPTAKCGGVTSSYRNDGQIAAWYGNCSPKPDFITWHSYLSSGTGETDVVTINKAFQANTNFASLRSSLGGFTGSFGNTEHNWNGDPTVVEPRNTNIVGAVLMAALQMTQIQADHGAVFDAIWDIWEADYGLIDVNSFAINPTGSLLTRLASTMPGEALGMSLGSNLTGAAVSGGASTGNGQLIGQATILNGKTAVQLLNVGDGDLTANLVLNGFSGSGVTKAEHSPANPNGALGNMAITGGMGTAVLVPAKSCVILAG